MTSGCNRCSASSNLHFVNAQRTFIRVIANQRFVGRTGNPFANNVRRQPNFDSSTNMFCK